MSIDESQSEGEEIINLSPWERWEVYHRLQALDVECKCSSHKPLQLRIHNPSQLLQVWSVLRQVQASRASLVSWLETCWQV